MTRRTLLSSLLVAASPRDIWAADGAAQPFIVIVHVANPFDELTRSKIALLFQKKVSRWPWGAESEPIDLPSCPARDAFLKNVLKSSEERLQEYWVEQVTARGIVRPHVASTPGLVVEKVAAKPGGIGYIPARAWNESELQGGLQGVKVLRVTP
jgi:ABC-type phosphate transport system substrate-binding protein